MTRIRASRSRALVVYAVITAMMLPSVTGAFAQPESAAAPARGRAAGQATLSMLVFPLEDQTGTGEDLQRIVTQELARALEQVGGFDAQVFAMNSPSASRQVEEGVLRTEDITPPYEPPAAVTVGEALGVDVVLVGSIVERTVDPGRSVVSLTISGSTYAVAENVDPDTGTPKAELKPFSPLFAAKGSSVERKVPLRGPITELDREAAMDAAKKAAQSITGIVPEPEKPRKREPLRKWAKVILPLIVVLGFALAASGGDDGPAEAAPPPVSLAFSRQNQGVLLTWGPPQNAPRPVMRYRVERSVNNGPRGLVDGGLVLPTQFSLIDFDVEVGDRIEYFIQAIYQGNVASDFVTFGTLVVS